MRYASLCAVVVVFLALTGFFFHRSWVEREKQYAIALASTAPADQALPALERCLERDPEDAEILKAIVGIRIQIDAPFNDTDSYLNRWIAVSPQDVEAHRARIVVMMQYKRFDEAIASAERVVGLVPAEREVRTLLASLYLKLGRWDDAVREYRLLLESGAQPEVRIRLAQAELERGHREAAMAAIEQALQHNPQSAEALFLRGMAEFQGGDYSAALATFQHCRRATPNELEPVLYHLALCLEHLGRTKEAQTAFTELRFYQDAKNIAAIAPLRPDDLDLPMRSAEAWLAVGKPDAAEKVLQDALRRSGHNRKVFLALATCYDALGRAEEARQARQKASQSP